MTVVDVTQEDYSAQVKLWFFRELSSEQRLALFKLCGLPVDEIGQNHSHQRRCLNRVLRLTHPAPDGEVVVDPTAAAFAVGQATFDQKGVTPALRELMQEYRLTHPPRNDAVVEALRDARRIIAEIDDYMKRPDRGDWGAECACCMGELLDDDREAIARIDAALSALKQGEA